ncbi:MAG: ATP-binding protein [SAR324 cluster bacterium]|nr:ATP-binding protein [SAR324 cluster bacterium]
MAATPPKPEGQHPQDAQRQAKIRTRILTIVGLLVVIAGLFALLLYYSVQNWNSIDSNLTIFVAVSVNIVLLTAAFYMILRNLFKLVYERRKPLAGVGLKTKLIIAFVALSLPSTVFHLMASGFMAFLLETWSQGEQKLVLESAHVVMGALVAGEEELLRVNAENILSYLPAKEEAYTGNDWLNGLQPRHQGGVVVYGQGRQPIVKWASGKDALQFWKAPPPEYFAKQGGFSWREIHQDQTLRRILLPVPDSPDQLMVEVFEVAPQHLSAAERLLARMELTNRFVSRDLFLLVVSVLVVITLLIILAATWVSFYLARGFVTPVEKLARGTRRVSEGELGYQVDGSSLGPLEGDFEELVDSFNQMSRQLKDQRQQLVATTEDLRNSHRELGERNWLVELLLENIDAGILSVNPQGSLTAMNRAAVRLVQPRSDPWLGRHFRVVLDKELVGLLEEMIEQLRGGAGRRISRNLTVAQNRKSMHLEVTALALENEEGAAEGTVVMLKDATEEQRKHRALAWREVARRVAHEIKNPLTPIQLSAQRIRRNYVDRANGDMDVLDQCTQTIITEVSSLKKMVNEFSQFAKMPESKPIPDNLNEVITEVARFYETGLPENVHIELNLGETLPEFPLDREQMKRAFTNLIDNAVASFPDSAEGTIIIQTEVHPITHSICVEVKDDGAGVPKEIRSRLFEPYTSTKANGTGLGLSIVNQIISDHHGYIRYFDRKPSGSIFSIEFKAS